MVTPQPASVPTYERTTLDTTQLLSELQGYILLLTSKPHTLTYLLTCISTITNEPHTYARVWNEIVKLRRLGLLIVHPPQDAPRVPLTNISDYQFKPAYQKVRYAA